MWARPPAPGAHGHDRVGRPPNDTRKHPSLGALHTHPNTSSPTEPPPELALAPERSRSQLDPASSSPASSPLRHPRVPPSTASSRRPGWAPSPPHPVSCRVPSIRPLIHTRQMSQALCGVVWQDRMDRVPALMELTVSGGHFEPRADSVLSVAHGGHPGLGTVQGPSC